MKVYTKGGDKGKTSLVSGARVQKSSLRIDVYGTIDELNACVGHLRDGLVSERKQDLYPFEQMLKVVQNELFDLGSELATPPSYLEQSRLTVLADQDVLRLEREIDEMQESLAPLTNFVLPGGHELNSRAHIARCVCRRAERLLVSLMELETDTRNLPLMYLNRLSDWLFVLSRTLSRLFATEEVLWEQKKSP